LSALRPEADLPSRVERIEELTQWLLSKRQAAKIEDGRPGETPQVLRLRMLIRALERVPAFRERLAGTFASTFRDCTGGGLFARLGLPTDRGFLAETIDRISRHYLPEPRDPRDLQQLVAHVFPSHAALNALSATPPELLHDFVGQLGRHKNGVDP
jgi:site-specific recombinase